MLSHKGGPVKQGYMRRVGSKVYELTAAGRARVSGKKYVNAETNGVTHPRIPRIPLTTSDDQSLRWLYECKTPETYTDALVWWSHDGRDGTAQMLRRLAALLEKKEAVLSNGRCVGHMDMAELLLVHERLLKVYRRQLREK
jgi:hypothetical protein